VLLEECCPNCPRPPVRGALLGRKTRIRLRREQDRGIGKEGRRTSAEREWRGRRGGRQRKRKEWSQDRGLDRKRESNNVESNRADGRQVHLCCPPRHLLLGIAIVETTWSCTICRICLTEHVGWGGRCEEARGCDMYQHVIDCSGGRRQRNSSQKGHTFPLADHEQTDPSISKRMPHISRGRSPMPCTEMVRLYCGRVQVILICTGDACEDEGSRQLLKCARATIPGETHTRLQIHVICSLGSAMFASVSSPFPTARLKTTTIQPCFPNPKNPEPPNPNLKFQYPNLAGELVCKSTGCLGMCGKGPVVGTQVTPGHLY
jgi:hypothetical protein